MPTEVDVYADLLFLINAGMDGLCLGMTARLLHRKPRAWRLITASILGGIYAVVALLLSVGQAAALLVDVGVCLLMCTVAFAEQGRGRVSRLFSASAVYVVLSMVMGGVMTAVFNLCNRAGMADYLPQGEDGLSAWVFTIVTLVGSAITLWGGRLFRRSTAVTTCTVTVEMDGRHATLRGLVDTGNLLRDPVGGRAVICVSPDAAAAFVSPDMRAFLHAEIPDATMLTDPKDMRRLRFIPAGTVAGQALLPGVRPDHVCIIIDGQDRLPREVDAILAFGTVGGMEDGAQALVPGELVR